MKESTKTSTYLGSLDAALDFQDLPFALPDSGREGLNLYRRQYEGKKEARQRTNLSLTLVVYLDDVRVGG